MDNRKKAMRTVFAAIIVVSVFTFAIPSIALESYAAENDTNLPFSSEAKLISLPQDVKSNLSLAHKKMSTDLLQLLDGVFIPEGQDSETLKMQMERLRQFLPAGSVSPTGDSSVIDDLVYVYVYLKPPAGTKTIEPYVWEVTDRDGKNHLAVAWVEVKALETLASLDEVRTIRTVMPPLVRTGSVTTEGDALHRTSDVRATYSQSGSGMKVGIISDGVDHWTSARNSGDLPTDLTVLSNTQGGDEGTAVLEIVHDMVPDADLYFHDRGSNKVAFNAAIDALVDAGCNVICDDVGWITEPFFEDGIIASHLNSVLAAHDIIYVSAAGNSGQEHYQGVYYNDGYDFHDFSRGSEPVYKYLYVNIPNNGEVTVVLQWNDQFGASGNDYDLGLYSYDLADYVAISEETQDGNDDPLEVVTYTNTGGSTIDAEIDVYNYAAGPKTLEVYIYTSNGASVYTDNINPADSIFGHQAVPGVIAVGAISASDPGNDNIEFFSSRGPVTISYPSPVSRPKPDLCGVDGVKITGAGGFGSWDGSNYRFFGTSAAAPHIAAIAAQVWGASPNATVNEVRNCLYSTAVDLGDSGNDYVYGYGRADAFDAYNCLAPASTPTVTTNAATNVEETTATLNGVISSDGGEAGQYRFEYDTNSGEPYAYNTGWTGSKTTGQSFSHAISSLSLGTKYYFRAQAKNSAGTASGSELTFLTKPDAPTSFSATPASTTQINLSWTKGSGAQKTKIQRKQGSYPSNKDDGTQVYFDTGSSASDLGLTPGTTYYYRAWSYAQGSEQWSDTYAQASTTTSSIGAPTVTTNAATNEEETTATLNGVITNDGGEACQYRFEYDTNSGEPYTYNTGWTGSKTTGQSFSQAISSLSLGTKYYFRAQAKNSAGTASGSELTFLTKPDAPTSFSATTASTTQINLSWTKGSGAQKTKIQRKQGSYPSNKDDGTQVYFDTGSSASDLGLTPGTTYYYRAWSYAQGSEQWSDNYAQAAVTTLSITPPTVTTIAAYSVTTTSARLNGNLDDTGGLSCEVWFEYGKTTAYGSITSRQTKSTPGTFSEGIGGLDDDTMYHFRAAASNSKGTVYGDDVTFTTFNASYTGILDTGSGTYPSIAGTHYGTITPYQTINVSKLYTYTCNGTGGHTEYASFSYSNGTTIAEAHWNGYKGDWHNISFNNSFALHPNETYNYTIRTGSYPQIIHATCKDVIGGTITCSEFVDINGKRHEGWIPAIRLE